MKRISSVFVIFFSSLLIISCVKIYTSGPYTSTTSMLIVLEKGHSSDYEEYWIRVYDPNNQTKEEAFKIIVNEEIVWNLIGKQ